MHRLLKIIVLGLLIASLAAMFLPSPGSARIEGGAGVSGTAGR